jgi:hypothetical protein
MATTLGETALAVAVQSGDDPVAWITGALTALLVVPAPAAVAPSSPSCPTP